MTRPRVLLADDHRLVAEGLARLLEERTCLVEIVGNGKEAVERAATLKPDVVVLDISMPVLNGIAAIRQIRENDPNVKLIALTMHAEPNYVRAALRAGASGYVLKCAAASELLTAIFQVARNRTYISEGLGLSATYLNSRSDSDVLTSRQREVLQLLADGYSAKQIAGALNISSKTVEFHKARLMEAVGGRTTADLIRFAVENAVTTK